MIPWTLPFLQKIEEEDEVTSTVSIPFLNSASTSTPAGQLSIKYDEETDTVINVAPEVLNAPGAQSLRNGENSADIQTPAGKKNQCLILPVGGLFPPSLTFRIWASDNVDTADGVLLYDSTRILGGGDFRTIPMLESPAGKFITVEAVTGQIIIRMGAVVTKAA